MDIRKKELDEVLSMRDLSLHTGGRKKKQNDDDNIE